MSRVHIVCKRPEQSEDDRFNLVPSWTDCEVYTVDKDGTKRSLDCVTAIEFQAKAGTEPCIAKLTVCDVTCELEGVQLEGGRGSGRTHRMLAEAVILANVGQQVLVAVADTASERMIGALAKDRFPDTLFRNITFATLQALEEGRFRGMKFDAYFEDHYASEVRANKWKAAHVAPNLL